MRQRSKRYPISFVYIAEVQTSKGEVYLFVAIDPTGDLAVTQLVDKVDRRTAGVFLRHLLEAVPYRIHKTLTVRWPPKWPDSVSLLDKSEAYD